MSVPEYQESIILYGVYAVLDKAINEALNRGVDIETINAAIKNYIENK